MAFITNKEREKRVKRSNQSYGLRKAFIVATISSLIVLIVLALIVTVTYVQLITKYQVVAKDDSSAWKLIYDMANEVPLPLITCKGTPDNFETNLSPFGWFLGIWTLLTLGLGIVSLILTLNMRSPKAAKKNINVLQGAALSGKKLESHANATQVYRERSTSPRKAKKAAKKK